MDQWVQKLSVIIILLTAGAVLHSSQRGASCWCPSQFTESHVVYANALCSSNASSRWTPVAQNFPTEKGAVHRQMMTMLLGENTALLRYLAGELILVCALYSLIKCIMSCTTFDVLFSHDLHRSYSKAPIYTIVQLVGCFMWILFAVLTYRSYSPDLLMKQQEVFLCDFDIRHQARVYNYVVQCMDASHVGMKMAVMTNMGLCVVVAFSKLVHLVAVFGIQPLLKVNKVAVKMVDRKVIKDSNEISLGFGLSDLYFAILVSGRDITPYVTIKQLQEDQRREKIPYGSRPGSMIC